MISEQGYARVRGVLRRRRFSILGVAAGALAVSAIVIGSLESRYHASAVVRALESQPARDYVAPTVAEPLGERLKTLRLAFLSRSLLGDVAGELHLAASGLRARDEIVSEMRAHLEVKVEGEDSFLLGYEDTDAIRAEQVVNHLAERFMASQVERRRQMTGATESALAAEADRLLPEVERRAQAVRSFKLAHYGALPEQQEQSLRLLDQTTMELNIQETNLDLDQERRRQLIAASSSPLRHQEEQLATALHGARTHYLAGHPEVRRIEAELERVKAARADEERELRRQARTRNPELVALEAQIRRTGAMLAGLRGRQADVRARVAATADNGHELGRLTADYDAVQAKYQAVLSRRREAELASRVESGLAGLRYQLVESATRPLAPSAPNRPLLALAALLGALALGLAVGFALDRTDTRIYSPAEVAAVGRPLELLACVPDLTAAQREPAPPTRSTRRIIVGDGDGHGHGR